MTEQKYDHSWTRSLPLFVVLTGLGFAGNYFGLSLFFNVDYVFGSIFSIIAVVLCGPALGTLSAAIATAGTYFLWNHPYTVITFSLEALVVGLLYRRRGGSVLILDTFFWMLIGLPLAWCLHSLVVELESSIVNVIILKQAINGISNALIASTVINNLPYLSRWLNMEFPVSQKKLHDTIFTLMVFLVIVPSMVGLILTSRENFKHIKEDIMQETRTMAEHLESSLSQWFIKKVSSVESIAQHSNGASSASTQLLLDSVRAASPDFTYMGILDNGLTSMAFSPSSDYNGSSNTGVSFSDRPYIRRLRQTERTIFSDVLPSRLGPKTSVIVLAAPIIRDGSFKGASVGTMETDAIKKMARWFTDETDKRFTILDSAGRVVTSSNEGVKPMDVFEWLPVADSGTQKKSTLFWSPPIQRGKSIMERWTRGAYITRMPLRLPEGWSIVVETPTSRYMRMLNSENTVSLSLMLLFTVITVFGSYGLSRLIIKRFEQLGAATSGLPERVSHGEDIVLPESRIEEIAALIENFRTMAQALRVKFSELNEARATLEHKVEERTLDLSRSHDMLYTILEGMSSFVYVADMQTYDVLFMNRAMRDAYGDAVGRKCWGAFHVGMEGPCPACTNDRIVGPDGKPADVPSIEKFNEITGRWYEVKSHAIRWVDGRLVRLTIFTDVDSRKKAEQVLRDAVSEKETMMKEVYHRVKNNLAVISSLLTLQSRRITDDETRGIFNESQGRVRSMSMIHERLYRANDLKSVEVSEYIQSLALQMFRSFNLSGRIKLDMKVPKLHIDVDTIIPCGLIVNELLTNALKYAFPGERRGTISVSLDKNSDHSYTLIVKDDGVGLPGDFSFTDNKTLGMTIISTLVKQLNGTMEIQSEGGTAFIITLYDRYVK